MLKRLFPAKAGAQRHRRQGWVPAFAGKRFWPDQNGV
jgi:hypothetical protein